MRAEAKWTGKWSEAMGRTSKPDIPTLSSPIFCPQNLLRKQHTFLQGRESHVPRPYEYKNLTKQEVTRVR